MSEEKPYIRLECMYVEAVAIAKVIKEDRIATEDLWNVSMGAGE